MVSAGIIPYRIRNDKIEFFVGHPGGPYWKNKPYFAFLKGGVESGEDCLEAALREFKEESGVSIPESKYSDIFFLDSVKQNSKKIVYAYAIQFDIDPLKCFSNECEVEHPSKSGINIKIPEIDKYEWMSFEELKDITSESHLKLYELLIQKIINGINQK